MSEAMDRVLGSDPLDVVRVTLSRQLRRVCYEAGLVDSPELPLYATRSEPPARALPSPTGTDGAGPISRTVAPDCDSPAAAPPYPARKGMAIPPTVGTSAQARAAGGPRQTPSARPASLDTQEVAP